MIKNEILIIVFIGVLASFFISLIVYGIKKFLDRYTFSNEPKTPKYWIVFTPYRTIFMENSPAWAVVYFGYRDYLYDCSIFVFEWRIKYELNLKIKELESKLG